MSILHLIAEWACMLIGAGALLGGALWIWVWAIDRVMVWLRVNNILLKFIFATVKYRMQGNEALKDAIHSEAQCLARKMHSGEVDIAAKAVEGDK